MTSLAEQIAYRLSDHVEREGRQFRTRCPIHRGHSLLLHDGDRVPVVGHCFGGCSDHDIQIVILEELKSLGVRQSGGNAKTAPPNETQRIANAKRIWDETKLACGTIAEAYLRARAITDPPPASVRFHPACYHGNTGAKFPAIVASVEIENRGITGVHRIYLRRDGSGKAAIEPDKAHLGVIRGGAVQLTPAGEELAIAEGIETALSFSQITGVPCWATCGAVFFAPLILPPLPMGRVLIIAVDNDSASKTNADRAAERFTREGRRVKFARPLIGNDFNDVLREITDGRK